MTLLPQKFTYFRRAATMTSVPVPLPRNSSVEMVTISTTGLSEAREPMRWRPDAPVDLDRQRGVAAPNTDIRRPLAERESKALALRDRQLQLELALLATAPKPLVLLPQPIELGRDLRIDVCAASRYGASFLTTSPTTSEAG
jgi:hypothetical protein